MDALFKVHHELSAHSFACMNYTSTYTAYDSTSGLLLFGIVTCRLLDSEHGDIPGSN